MNSTTNLPYRLSERTFREYEDAIAQIVDTFPVAVKIEHKTLAPTTFSARLRDAIESLDRFNWSTRVDMVRFKTQRNHIIVKHTDKGVYAGGKLGLEALEEINKCTTLPVTLEGNLSIVNDLDNPKLTEPFTLEEALLPEIKAAVFFAAHGLFNRPIRLLPTFLDDELVAYFEENFDIRLDKQPDNSYILS